MSLGLLFSLEGEVRVHMQTGFLIFTVFDGLEVIGFVNDEWKGIGLGVAGRYGVNLEGHTIGSLVEN